ncbi:hypothetical protein BU15DRAFT_69095 [Melanogaster broomeanus]|nr:hypothetical protein BU15DRAFT_69095 [Melanogaster broomeanus]
MTLKDNALWQRDTGGSPGHGDGAPRCREGLIGIRTRVADNCVEGQNLLEEVEETFTTLLLIDHQLHAWAQNTTKLVQGLGYSGCTRRGAMAAGELNKITHLHMGEDEANAVLCHELVMNMNEFLAAVRSLQSTLTVRTPEDMSQREHASEVVHTGKIFRTEDDQGLMFNRKEVEPTFPQCQSGYLLALLITLILNIFGHVTRPWCNATLGLLNLLLGTMLGTTPEAPASASPSDTEHEHIPRDIHTVQK